MYRLLAALAASLFVMSGTASAQVTPTTHIFTPTAGAAIDVGVPVLVTGGTINGEAGGVTRAELTFDDGRTWHSIDTAGDWRYLYTPSAAGEVTVVARGYVGEKVGPPSTPVTFHVGGAGNPPERVCECRFDLPNGPYAIDPDGQAVELGLRTRVDRPGKITGLIVLRGVYTGPVTTRVWSSGEVLAEKVSSPASYYQRVMFDTPVDVTPGREYVVSYYTPEGGYAAAEEYFTGTVVKAPFIAPIDAGVYQYGGGFPTDTWNGSNYWIMPLFQP